MNDQILDNEAFEITNEPIQKHRVGAIFLEGMPIFLGIISSFLGYTMLVGFSALLSVLIYILGGWYIFKGQKQRKGDIIYVTLTILFILIPFLSFFINPPLNLTVEVAVTLSKRISIAVYITTFFIVACIIKYFLHRERPLEWRLSIKLLSRLLIFLYINLDLIETLNCI
jgi:hypothetical protein